MEMKFPLLNDKYRDFLNHPSRVDFMEGTTYGGKTTVGLIKFMESVIVSDKQLHIISGLDTGVIEKNMINKDLGILDVWGDYVEYRAKGNRDHSSPHLSVMTDKGEKIIYLLGYDNKRRWQKVLGGQYGVVMIDEINTADMDFVQEIWLRFDYLIATLNPDNPELDVYEQFINRSRPIDKYVNDIPTSIYEELTEPEEEGWVHWFFSYDDNPSLTEEKRESLLTGVPKGTKQYKNKILGERGKAEGLVFPNFGSRNVISYDDVMGKQYAQLNIGIDTSYSMHTEDKIVFSLVGLTKEGELVVIDESVYNNKGRGEDSYTPSDISGKFWLKFREWSSIGAINNIYIDSADQATRLQMTKDGKDLGIRKSVLNSTKMKIIDRERYTNGWIGNGEDEKVNYYVNEICVEHIKEMNFYSYDDGVPEDRNDHTINATQYAWATIRDKVGVKQVNKKSVRRDRRRVARQLR